MRDDPAVDELRGGPAATGVFATLQGPGAAAYHLIALDSSATPVRDLGPDAGLVAALRSGDDPPTWLVTGSTGPAVRRAASSLDAAALRDRYAVAAPLHGRLRWRLPLEPGGERMRPALAYVPRRTPLHDASAAAATVYLGSFAVRRLRLLEPDRARRGGRRGRRRRASPPGRGGRFAPRPAGALTLGVFIVAVNGLVAQRGDTVLVHGLWLPLLGATDVSAEALAEGGVLALRIVVVLMAFAVHSACVDPDRVLRLLRPLARRSALTATLIARLVPLAAADHVRLGEAAALRGPAAAPVGRAALARRLVAGSLDRAVDVAATLELRGYAHGPPGSARGDRRSRHDGPFLAAGLAIAVVGLAARVAGVGAFEPYPTVSIDTGWPTLALAACVPLAAALPFAIAARRRGRRMASRGARRATHPGGRAVVETTSHWSGSTRSPIATRAVGPSALRDLDLEIEPGELIVLAGRSGSGKTTLLRACCGLVPHYYGGEVAGEIEVAGLDVRHHGPAELGGAVGLVAQDPETQVVSTTVRGELALPLEMRGEPPAARARAVEEVALALAIPHLLDRTADTLSGGELQRVALAAALVGRPRLVLLDEPTSQLDPVAGDELIGLLRRLNEEWGLAVVLAEHRLERCLAAADRVLALVEGRIAFDGAPGAFLQWALASDSALATPAARLFDLAGLRPPPVGVKAARAATRRPRSRALGCRRRRRRGRCRGARQRRAAAGVVRRRSRSPTCGSSSTMAAGPATSCAASTWCSSRASGWR